MQRIISMGSDPQREEILFLFLPYCFHLGKGTNKLKDMGYDNMNDATSSTKPHS